MSEEEESTEESESDLSGTRSVSLKYEGTCEFLRTCSTYSRNLPVGKVSWGCTGVGTCSDSAKWVAGPNRSYCGKTVRICKGSQCTNALVKDVSVTRDWEASNGVLDALDLPHGLLGRCGGFGGGRVTISMSSSASLSKEPAGDGEGASTPDPSRDDGCYSATLDEDVPELTCVESASTSVVYQCKSGKWHRGVQGNTGPYGECASMRAR